MSICLDDFAIWMRSNRLQLNTSKTELLWFATARRQSQLPCTPLRVGPHLVDPLSTILDLGIYIDADLSRRSLILKTTASCFAALRQLRTVRRCLPMAAHKSLIVSLVLSRLDYGNATLSGLPEYQFRRLQSVINAAARSIFNLRWSDHVTSALIIVIIIIIITQLVTRHKSITISDESQTREGTALDGTALVECSRSSRLQGCDVGLPLSS